MAACVTQAQAMLDQFEQVSSWRKRLQGGRASKAEIEFEETLRRVAGGVL
jgi:hypothetical protein